MDISELIDLPDVKVVKVTKNERGHLLITVETKETSTPCRQCGKQLSKRHGYDRERKLRHLPVFGKQTYIVYRSHRYICEDCDNNPTTTASPSWHTRGSNFTKDYESNVLLQLVNSTIADVCMKEELTDALVTGVVDRNVESEINWRTVNSIDVLGIDEIALKKGHKDYVTLITSRHDGEIKLLAVIDGHKKSTVKAFLKSIPRRLKTTISAICTDMYDGYIFAAKEVFKKKTIIVVDRFHVAKQYRGELDKYRQKIDINM